MKTKMGAIVFWGISVLVACGGSSGGEQRTVSTSDVFVDQTETGPT